MRFQRLLNSDLVSRKLDRILERQAVRGQVVLRASKRAGERVMESIKRFMTQKLTLKVNEAKSAVARP